MNVSRAGVNVFCSEIVWGVYYKVLVDGEILTELGSIPMNVLQSFISFQTPRGGIYQVYNRESRTLQRYSSVFYSLLSRPVLSVDQYAVVQSLSVVWKGIKPGTIHCVLLRCTS